MQEATQEHGRGGLCPYPSGLGPGQLDRIEVDGERPEKGGGNVVQEPNVSV